MSKSRILQAMQTGQSEWQGKQLTKFALKMENGDTGTYTIGFKETDKVPEAGDELDYEIADRGYGPEIKPNKPAFSGGGGFKKWTPEQVSEQNAVKLTCSALEGGNLELKDYKSFYTDCYNWFLTDAKAKEVTPTHAQKAEAMLNSGVPSAPGTTDDLPF